MSDIVEALKEVDSGTSLVNRLAIRLQALGIKENMSYAVARDMEQSLVTSGGKHRGCYLLCLSRFGQKSGLNYYHGILDLLPDSPRKKKA